MSPLKHHGNPNYREPICLSCILKPNCQINALYQNKKLPKTVHDVLSVNKAVMIEQDEKNKPAFLSIVECFIVKYSSNATRKSCKNWTQIGSGSVMIEQDEKNKSAFL